MTNELRQCFQSIDHDLMAALDDFRAYKTTGMSDFLTASRKNLPSLPEKVRQVESAVQKRLRYEDA